MKLFSGRQTTESKAPRAHSFPECPRLAYTSGSRQQVVADWSHASVRYLVTHRPPLIRTSPIFGTMASPDTFTTHHVAALLRLPASGGCFRWLLRSKPPQGSDLILWARPQQQLAAVLSACLGCCILWHSSHLINTGDTVE